MVGRCVRDAASSWWAYLFHLLGHCATRKHGEGGGAEVEEFEILDVRVFHLRFNLYTTDSFFKIYCSLTFTVVTEFYNHHYNQF